VEEHENGNNRKKLSENIYIVSRRIYPVPRSITGLVEPGKKNPRIFFFRETEIFMGCQNFFRFAIISRFVP
jgi:hypothetical protein